MPAALPLIELLICHATPAMPLMLTPLLLLTLVYYTPIIPPAAISPCLSP